MPKHVCANKWGRSQSFTRVGGSVGLVADASETKIKQVSFEQKFGDADTNSIQNIIVSIDRQKTTLPTYTSISSYSPESEKVTPITPVIMSKGWGGRR